MISDISDKQGFDSIMNSNPPSVGMSGFGVMPSTEISENKATFIRDLVHKNTFENEIGRNSNNTAMTGDDQVMFMSKRISSKHHPEDQKPTSIPNMPSLTNLNPLKQQQ